MSGIPKLPEDEREGPQRTRPRRAAIIAAVAVILVLAALVVLHLNGAISVNPHG